MTKLERTEQLQKRLKIFKAVTFVITLIVTIIITATITTEFNKAYAQDNEYIHSYRRLYTSYLVKESDTPESIAEYFCPEDDVNDYIENIMFTNHLVDKEDITPGMNLIVYYYM